MCWSVGIPQANGHGLSNRRRWEECHGRQQSFARNSALIPLAAAGFWGCFLLDLGRTNEWEVRTFSEPVWVVLQVLTNILGALMWLVAGGPQRP